MAEYLSRFKVGAEIGVDTGVYARILCQANPDLELNCVDLWERRGGKLEEAKTALNAYNVNFIKKSSMEAAKDFDPESLDFVYIDAAHDFDNVMRDIIEWGSKVRKGGVIAGHDYANNRNCGVEDAVNVYAKRHGLEVHVLPEPSEVWEPKYPNEDNRQTGLSWWMKK